MNDQCGNQVLVDLAPSRIISLVPSQTELLHYLGLDKEIVGITRYCVHPTHWKSEKTVVGGTKQFDFKVIASLQPDLIIGNKEENYKEGIEYLQERFPVWISDICTLQQALEMIRSVGALTNRLNESITLCDDIGRAFRTIVKTQSKRVLYLIWRKPWMAAGSGTFIHTMLTEMGLINVLASKPRYPELSDEDIRTLDPDYIFLSSEPYPFQEKHKQQLQSICLSSKMLLVDGEMFSWYGSRLLKAPEYFNSLRAQLA
jgi:ABC-type Fe3+-hydroxamate transport system substrate-binding protein